MERKRVESIAGMATTGRRLVGPASDLVELTSDNGLRHTAVVFHEEHRRHEAIGSALDVVLGFLESPMVTGLVELVAVDREQGAFVYPTGEAWSAAEVIRLLADLGETAGVRAGLELMYVCGQVLTEAADVGQSQGVYSHGGLTPWRVMLRRDGQVLVIGHALPQVEILAFHKDHSLVPREDSFRYCPPERIEAAAEDLSSDLFSLALIAFELMTGKPVYDGLVHDIRQQAARGEGSRRLFRFREVLPQSVRDLLTYALRPSRGDRYPSGQDFLESVRAVLTSADATGPSLMDLMARVAAAGQRTGTALEGGKTQMLSKEDLLAMLGDDGPAPRPAAEAAPGRPSSAAWSPPPPRSSRRSAGDAATAPTPAAPEPTRPAAAIPPPPAPSSPPSAPPPSVVAPPPGPPAVGPAPRAASVPRGETPDPHVVAPAPTLDPEAGAAGGPRWTAGARRSRRTGDAASPASEPTAVEAPPRAAEERASPAARDPSAPGSDPKDLLAWIRSSADRSDGGAPASGGGRAAEVLAEVVRSSGGGEAGDPRFQAGRARRSRRSGEGGPPAIPGLGEGPAAAEPVERPSPPVLPPPLASSGVHSAPPPVPAGPADRKPTPPPLVRPPIDGKAKDTTQLARPEVASPPVASPPVAAPPVASPPVAPPPAAPPPASSPAVAPAAPPPAPPSPSPAASPPPASAPSVAPAAPPPSPPSPSPSASPPPAPGGLGAIPRPPDPIPSVNSGEAATLLLQRAPGTRPLRLRLPGDLPLAEVVARLVGHVLPVRMDLGGGLLGWWRLRQGGERLDRRTPLGRLAADLPVELDFVLNQPLSCELRTELTDPPTRQLLRLGSAVPVSSLLDHLSEWLELPAGRYLLFARGEELGAHDILADLGAEGRLLLELRSSP